MPFLTAIGETMRCYSQFRARHLEQYGIVGYQYLYLTTLCRRPGLSQDELAERLIFDKSTVARQLAALEEKGFVTRRRNEKDKREYLVFPTQKALDLYPVINEVSAKFRERLTQGLDPREWDKLEEIIAHVQERAKAALEEK